MQLQVFNFKGAEVRTVMVDGQPWWVAKDVCAILEIKNTTDALKRLHATEKGLGPIYTPGGVQQMNIVSKTGLLKLIGRSDKPSAIAFQDWVFGEVIPSVLETGGYAAPNQGGSFAEIMAELRALKAQQAAAIDPKALIAGAIANKLELLSPAVQKIVVTQALALPPEVQSIWTASQISDELGRMGIVASREKIGKVAKAHGIQCPKEEQENEWGYWAETSVNLNGAAKIFPQFQYRKTGRDRLVAIITAANVGSLPSA